jgi:hypothetical protein
VTPSWRPTATPFTSDTRGYSVCGHQVVCHGSQVPFFVAITKRYRKFMGSITERVISGSNSNSPNNTGWNRLNTNISVTVTTRRSTWQDTPVIALPPWLPSGVPRPRNLSLLPPLFFKLLLQLAYRDLRVPQ